MPYLEDELYEGARSDTNVPSSSKHFQGRLITVRNYVFEEFSDPSGLLATQQMPDHVEVRDPDHPSWPHRFETKINDGLDALGHNHMVDYSNWLGSFSIKFVHTIRDEDAEDELPINI